MDLGGSEEALQLVVCDPVFEVGVEPIIHCLFALLESEKLRLDSENLSEAILEKLSVLGDEGADLLVFSGALPHAQRGVVE